MNLTDLLTAIRNDRIKFVTTRPEGSQFTTLERRVLVTGPEEAVELARSGELAVLDELVKLLKDPERAWAANVLLAALTRKEEKTVDVFAAQPAQWWPALGETAFERWDKWLNESREKLVWDAPNQFFEESESPERT